MVGLKTLDTDKLPPIETSEPTYKRELNDISPFVNNRPPRETSEPTYKR